MTSLWNIRVVAMLIYSHLMPWTNRGVHRLFHRCFLLLVWKENSLSEVFFDKWFDDGVFRIPHFSAADSSALAGDFLHFPDRPFWQPWENSCELVTLSTIWDWGERHGNVKAGEQVFHSWKSMKVSHLKVNLPCTLTWSYCLMGFQSCSPQ